MNVVRAGLGLLAAIVGMSCRPVPLSEQEVAFYDHAHTLQRGTGTETMTRWRLDTSNKDRNWIASPTAIEASRCLDFRRASALKLIA